MKEVEEKTARLYEDIHPYIEVDETINDYLESLKVDMSYFKGKDILDCGFGGTGWAVELFVRSGARSVTGIDLNEKWVTRIGDRLKKYNHPALKLMQGNVLELPFAGNTF